MGAASELTQIHGSESMKYFVWLCGLVGVDEPDHTYFQLAHALHSIRFLWSIPMDENRAADGVALRKKQQGCEESTDDPKDCTFFEMLVALALKITDTFEEPEDEEGAPTKWFFIFVENLGLDQYSDEYVNKNGKKCDIFCDISEIRDRFLSQGYKFDGEGWIFPLNSPPRDQRKVEIWCQLQDFLAENYHF